MMPLTVTYGVPRLMDFGGEAPFADDDGNQHAMAYQAIGINAKMPIPGRTDKAYYTVLRYMPGDPITSGTCRSQIVSWPVPQRLRVRWDFDVAFGGPAAGDEWVCTPYGRSPVLWWQLKTASQGHPALAAIVDTDPADPTRLCVYFSRRTGGMPAPARVGQIGGLARGAVHKVAIDAYLSDGASGEFAASVNGVEVARFAAPTLVDSSDHCWYLAAYMYNDLAPCDLRRAVYFATARMSAVS